MHCLILWDFVFFLQIVADTLFLLSSQSKKAGKQGGYFVGSQRFCAAQRCLLLKREYANVISVMRNILQNKGTS